MTGADVLHVDEPLPPFDKTSKCVKCGWEIKPPEPPKPMPAAPGAPAGDKKPAAAAPAKKKLSSTSTNVATSGYLSMVEDFEFAAAGGVPAGFMPPTPEAPPPTVAYCNGTECPCAEDGEPMEEHMHQFCDVCGYEWLSLPLDAKKAAPSKKKASSS